ncbi:hypothetical protein [Pseudoalteromonas luteoviolacea]|uniref:Uncharacterized protein n=1 Tax=Pseudoalteromonas luteoviolacea S4054 TaxID=1129367 RepID=A0A0F6AIA0_9GAMM|nr:hypothetical protein [Pseudoalteromonas luteoviolacea]AOT09146.1 hypothetical protein S4054249_15410 [Pseudoalteromonas luteoviolacea]AOT14059.1 hypothetical protein S40542_15380 [Pseudoalteromonas luteoviolacea]AOT18974.1 hypothetical protein S4054_15385 [Pseudoalteromonas luteoviolacea]KKE85154.1 hypothetical protein N479_06870 [Pseudoalteromonas luteoviolacea S4054]KZN70272.1 hypothetical protein N481_01980 [Pseudoalteromonas luteoviolacea S4047-1]
MNLKLNKKSIKKLTTDKHALPKNATPQIGGGFGLSVDVCNTDGVCWTQQGPGRPCEIYSHEC